ncbi:unnamed protein product [Discosporangium mesarthrocarpum]
MVTALAVFLILLQMIGSWMFFPILALAAKEVVGVEEMVRLRPWSECVHRDSGDSSCHLQRPAWQGSRVHPGRILFVSIGFYGHAIPLLAIAEEMAARGHAVTFATHERLRGLVEGTPGVTFLSAGRMPVPEEKIRAKLKSLSQTGGFWGLLTLLSDVYLTLGMPMYHALLANLGPGIEERASVGMRYGRRTGVLLKEGAGACEKERLDMLERPCVSSGGQCKQRGQCRPRPGEEGSASGGPTNQKEAGGKNREGGCEHMDKEGQKPDQGLRFGSEQWGRGAKHMRGTGTPVLFDLMVLDMGTLGGLHLAHKLDIPYMFNSPSLLFDLSGQHVSATLPGWGTGLARQMTMWQRLQNVISPRALSVFLTPAFIGINKARRELGLEPFRTQDDVFCGARILVNTVFGLEYHHSLGPLIEMTGPLLPPPIARELSGWTSSSGWTSPSSSSYSSRSSSLHWQGGMGETAREPRVGLNQGLGLGLGIGIGGTGTHARNGEGNTSKEGALDLPFLISSWLTGDGGLVAPGTSAAEAAARAARWGTAGQATSVYSETKGLGDSKAGMGRSTATEGELDQGSRSMCPLRGGEGEGEGQGGRGPGDQGVIYVSLGHMPQMEKWQLLTVVQAFSSPSDSGCWGGGGGDREPSDPDGLGLGLHKYRVLWMMPKDQRERLLSSLQLVALPPALRVKVMGGLPHLSIIAHPSVKAVVSHCGMAVAQEALVFGKPLLCLPVFAEQEDVTRRVVDAGAGIGVSVRNMTRKAVREGIADVMHNPQYRESANVLAHLLRRAGGTLRAADLVEGTLQLGGGKHLSPLELQAPWHESSSADVYAILLAGVVLLMVFGYAALAGLICCATALGHRASNTLTQTLKAKANARRRQQTSPGYLTNPASTPGGPQSSENSSSLDRTSVSAAAQAAAAAAAASAAAASGRPAPLWATSATQGHWGGGVDEVLEEALATLLGDNLAGREEVFPEDAMPELDGPAVDRQPTPGSSNRNGDTMHGNSVGVHGGSGHLRSLSGEVILWPTSNGDGRGVGDLRNWGVGNGVGYSNGGEVAPHHFKRWD